MYTTKVQILAFVCALLLLFPVHTAQAKPPVVIQFYGEDNCTEDITAQQNLHDVLLNQENIILLNCRQNFIQDKESEVWLDFCVRDNAKLRQKFSKFGVFGRNIYINGRWDANLANPMPAVNLGRIDQVQEISIEYKKPNVLNIQIPALKSTNANVLTLYLYAPTRDSEKYFIDADTELTDNMRSKLYEKKSVPFVTKTRLQPLQLRPIIARRVIGTNIKSQSSFQYPIDFAELLIKDNIEDISYVAILSEETPLGPIIAAGEVMSVAEMNYILPQSNPLNIEFYSLGDYAAQ